MTTLMPHEDLEADPRIKAVFDDIRATRKTDFINNMWRWLAADASLLETTWAEVKAVMATPSRIDPLTKEMIYLAVSIANNCTYCVHSHTAAARAKGMSPDQYGELLAIIWQRLCRSLSIPHLMHPPKGLTKPTRKVPRYVAHF